MKFDSVPQVCSLCSWHLHRNCLILRKWFCAASSFDVNGLTFKICKANTEGSYEMTCRGLQDNQQPHPIPSPIHPHPATKHHRGFFAASSGHVYLHVLAARKVAKQIINSNRGCLKHLDQQILSKSRQNVRQIIKNHHNASRRCMWTPFTPKYGCTMVCLPSSFWF